MDGIEFGPVGSVESRRDDPSPLDNYTPVLIVHVALECEKPRDFYEIRVSQHYLGKQAYNETFYKKLTFSYCKHIDESSSGILRWHRFLRLNAQGIVMS